MPLGQLYPTYGGQGHVWFGLAATVGGVATFNPTDDGTPTGNALFTKIAVAFHGASLDTASAIAMPMTSLKLVSADRLSVTINCIVGAVTGGDSVLPAPDGTVVSLQLWGQ